MGHFRICPRCKERGYEVLKTHAYCVSCNYSPNLVNHRMSRDDLPIPTWAEKTTATKLSPVNEEPSGEVEASAGGVA